MHSNKHEVLIRMCPLHTIIKRVFGKKMKRDVLIQAILLTRAKNLTISHIPKATT